MKSVKSPEIRVISMKSNDFEISYTFFEVSHPSVLRRLKEELAWAIDKQLRVVSNKMLFKTVILLRN